MALSLEPDFKKVTGYCYSESGHNYQLTYSNNAAKNSSPVLFVNGGHLWYAFKKYESVDDKEIEVFKDSCAFLTKGVFSYGYGHKINLPLYKKYLSDCLLERDYNIGCLYAPSIAPGLVEYVKLKILTFHNNFSLEYRMSSGLTVFNIVFDFNSSSLKGFMVYPNSKITYGNVLYEGKIEEEEILQLGYILFNKKITIKEFEQLICFESKKILEEIEHKELKGWEIYSVDPFNKILKKIK